MTHRIAIAALLAFAAASAMAEDQQCTAARKNTVAQSLAVIDEIDAHVEAVPPEEANYIQTEWVAAMKDNNLARYNLVSARPYYTAWALHGSLQRVKADLGSMNGPAYGESLEKYQVKRAAVVMVRLEFAVNDFMQYTQADNRRSQQVMTADQQGRYSQQLGSLSPILSTYIDCTVDAIK
jgi:hypothetical protein